MCKTRFDSQGMILNSILKKNIKKKNINGTRGVGMQKKQTMENKHFDLSFSIIINLLL